MDLSDLLSNRVYRVALGVVLIFISLVVFPSMTGVGPLAAAPVAQSFVSATYDPSNDLVVATVNLFSSSQVSGTSERVAFRLRDTTSGVASDPYYLYANIVDQRIEFPYQKSDALGEVICLNGTGSVDVAVQIEQLTSFDFDRAILQAVKNAMSQIGADSPQEVFGNAYRVYAYNLRFEEGFFIFGGKAVADVLVCGAIPDRYLIYSFSGTPSYYAKLSMYLRDSRGNTVGPVTLDNVIGSKQVAKLPVSGGYAMFEVLGQLSGYVPAEYKTPPSRDLLVRYRYDDKYILSVYLIDPNRASLDGYRTQYTKLYSLFTSPSIFSSGCVALFPQSYQEYQRHLSIEADYPLVFGVSLYCGDWTTTLDEVRASYNTLKTYFSNLTSSPLSSLRYEYSPLSISDVMVVTTKQSYPSPLYSFLVKLVVPGEFAGVYYTRPEPEIVSVEFEQDKCYETGCVAYVTVRNKGTKEDQSGLVTVTFDSAHFHGSTVASLNPGEVKKITVTLTRVAPVESSGEEEYTVKVVAAHPFAPAEDVYNGVLTVEKTPKCVLTYPECHFTGSIWYYYYCPSPESDMEKVECAPGQACVDGQGCVDDVLLEVNCVDAKTYVLKYSQSGEKYALCDAGTFCDVNLAAQNKVPPCVRSEWVPPPPPEIPEPVAKYAGTAYKDLSLGLLLIGIALVVMP